MVYTVSLTSITVIPSVPLDSFETIQMDSAPIVLREDGLIQLTLCHRISANCVAWADTPTTLESLRIVRAHHVKVIFF